MQGAAPAPRRSAGGRGRRARCAGQRADAAGAPQTSLNEARAASLLQGTASYLSMRIPSLTTFVAAGSHVLTPGLLTSPMQAMQPLRMTMHVTNESISWDR